MSDPLRVLIADDHPVVRRGLEEILTEAAGLEVAGTAERADDVLSRLEVDDGLDVLILDLSMPGARGLDLLERVHDQRPETAVLVLSIHPETQYALRCLRAGASGYLNKASAPEHLIEAVKTVAQGRRYLSPTLTERLLLTTTEERPEHERLSQRERQVLLRLAGGHSVGEIARELELSAKTVSTYRNRLLDKLGLGSNAELTRYAIEHGLLPG